jgi:response regulator NasT
MRGVRLWHVSEQAGIARFEPRAVPEHDSPEALVWAIDEAHLPAYWFPRDVPRATFWAGPATSDADVERFLGGDRALRVHAIQREWLDDLRRRSVVAYRLPPDPFVLWDANAGYWVSRAAVVPLEERRLGDLLRLHADAGIELRIVRSLAPLWERVIASTLAFSGIRLLNLARPRRENLMEMRILIAEDETIIRLDLRDLLERAGHEVVAEARDGEEAIAFAREHEPELAVMDVKMPKLDGIEAARLMLEERPIPIVMLTAYGQEELVTRAVEAGVYGYLVKPFREQDLVPAIATARARHEELAAVREEAESLADALAARKAIERAKGLLMAKDGLSEQDAFARLRRASQVSGRPLRVIAEAVIATLGQE